jgi:hypothetical protein
LCLAEINIRFPDIDEELRQTDLINHLFCLQKCGLDTPATTRTVQEIQPCSPVVEMGKSAVLYEYDRMREAINELLAKDRRAVQMRDLLRTYPLVQRAMHEASEIRRLLIPSGSNNRSRIKRPVKRR